jgi:hypothetical protein
MLGSHGHGSRKSITGFARVWVVVIMAALCMRAEASIVRGQGANSSTVSAAFLSNDDETYLLLADGSVQLLTAYPTRAGQPGTLALDTTSTTIATTRPYGILTEIILITLPSGQVSPLPGTRERNCYYPAFHPDGVHLVVVCNPAQNYFASTLDLFHRERGFVRTLLTRNQAPGMTMVLGGALLAPNGQTAIVREFLGDYAIRYWRMDLSRGQIAQFTPQGPEYSVHLQSFLPSGQLLATSCALCSWMGPSGPPEPIRSEIQLL